MKMPVFFRSVSRLKNSWTGFTLVEITISLGLVSFALVTVLGLLPAGLTTLRSSMNQTVEAQILQTITSQAVISSFSNLTDRTVYFDDEGLSVENLSEAYYTANVTPDVSLFPGSDRAADLPGSLTNLKIALVARPNPSAQGTTNYYSIQIANSGK